MRGHRAARRGRARTRTSASVASVFVSRWDVAVADKVPAELRQPARHRDRASGPTRPTATCSPRTAGCGSPTPAPARSACSGPAPDQGSEGLGRALRRGARRAAHDQHDAGEDAARLRRPRRDRRDAAARRRRRRGGARRSSRGPAIDVDALAAELQKEGADAFVKSWNELLACIAEKSDRAHSSRLSEERDGDDDHAAAQHERPPGRRSRPTTRRSARLHLRELFADDPDRGERLTAEAAGLYLDYSKHRVTDETLTLLLALAEEVRPARAASTRCSAASKINVTENRAVLHVALRAPRERSRSSSTARTSCPKCTRCSTGWPPSPTASAAASGRATPASASRNVVNIGIGGSDLGPVMAYEALRHYSRPRPDVPLRLERRRHRLRRGDARPRPGRRRSSSSRRRRSRRSRR